MHSARQLDRSLAIEQGTGQADERLDARARRAYRARLVELDDELADAERNNDHARLERARAEHEMLLDELTSTVRGGRAGPDADRARIAATKAIKSALDRIAACHPELGAPDHRFE